MDKIRNKVQHLPKVDARQTVFVAGIETHAQEETAQPLLQVIVHLKVRVHTQSHMLQSESATRQGDHASKPEVQEVCSAVSVPVVRVQCDYVSCEPTLPFASAT